MVAERAKRKAERAPVILTHYARRAVGERQAGRGRGDLGGDRRGRAPCDQTHRDAPRA